MDFDDEWLFDNKETRLVFIDAIRQAQPELMFIHNKADYLAFGSFSKSKLKPNAKKANLSILKWAKKNIKKPIVAIGGINNSNYKKLIKSGAKYIAISSYIWDNPKLKPEIAIRKFK